MPDAPKPVDAELSAGRGAGFVFAITLVLTLLMAAPVILSPRERIFGAGEILSPSDPSRDALVVIDQFRTGSVPWPYLQPLTDLPGRALGWLVGPVVAYNLVVLLTFPLSALLAYLLARHLSLTHFGATVTGLAFAFLPFHVMQAGGHPHIAQTQWLPLYLLALWRFVEAPGAARALLVSAAALLAALADFYMGFIIAVMSPVAVVAAGAVGPRRADGQRGRNLALSLLIVTGALVIGYFAIRILAPAAMSMTAERSDLFSWSARWWSYLIPPADHPILGPSVREFWTERGVGVHLLEHQQVSLGLALVGLALIPLWRFIRGDKDAAIRVTPALAFLGAVALICSLSPERRIGSFDFVRPSAFLYMLAPMFRAYSRFGIVVGLMTALLAGVGVSWLCRSRGPGGRRLAALLLTLVSFEFLPFPPWRSRDVLPTSAHRWLVSAPGPVRVLDCVTPARFTDTLAARLFPHHVEWLGSDVDDCGEPHLGSKLGALGFTHLIARMDTRLAPESGLEMERGFEDARLFRVAAGASSAYLRSWSGFHEREYDGSRTWRWLEDRGAMHFSLPSRSTRTVLEIELRSFPGTRRVLWSVNGRRQGEIEVTPTWRRYELGLGSDEKGELLLTLSNGPAVIANDILGNDDRRALGIAVGVWRLQNP